MVMHQNAADYRLARFATMGAGAVVPRIGDWLVLVPIVVPHVVEQVIVIRRLLS
jgi:hypothetical protein